MNDLVQRLRDRAYASYDECTDAHLAADRLEELEERTIDMEAALRQYACHCAVPCNNPIPTFACGWLARRALTRPSNDD